jgi:hypothetical protein
MVWVTRGDGLGWRRADDALGGGAALRAGARSLNAEGAAKGDGASS